MEIKKDFSVPFSFTRVDTHDSFNAYNSFYLQPAGIYRQGL